MKIIATMFATFLMFMLQGAFAGAQATNASGHCTGMSVVDFVSSDVRDQTNSTNWANVTDGHLNFTTSATGCVMITFTGVAETNSANTAYEFLLIRTLLDGNSPCVPALANTTLLGAITPAPYSANTIVHICKNVAAGAHTLQVQYRGDFGSDVQINGHVLTVLHN